MRGVAGAIGGDDFEAAALAPLREPFQELNAAKADGFAFGNIAAIGFGEPLDELPVRRAEQFLLVRGTLRQLQDFGEGAEFVTGAGTKKIEVDRQLAKPAKLRRWLDGAAYAQPCTRGVEMRRRGRKKP